MCGRYASFRSAVDLVDAFAIAVAADDARLLPPSWNVAPTQPTRIVVERVDGDQVVRSLRLARWGLVPSWAKDPSIGSRLINARSETVASKPSFSRALAKRRALIPVDGYYEWSATVDGGAGSGTVPATGSHIGSSTGRRSSAKQPWLITAAGGDADGETTTPPVLAIAGLYELWRDPARADDDPERWLVTTTVITRAATGPMTAIHDRQPVILPPELWDRWLDPGVGADEAAALLTVEPPRLTLTPISTRVNAVAVNDPSLWLPLDAAD